MKALEMLHRKNIVLLMLQLFIMIGSIDAHNHIVMTPTLQKLLNDWSLYKLDAQGDPYLHQGDLLEHSLWVYFSAIELLETENPYGSSLHITDREKEIVALACLLHDIGKAGRKDLFDKTHKTLYYSVCKNSDHAVSHIDYLQDRQEHPCICFEYLAAPFLNENITDGFTPAQTYHFADQTLLDVQALYKELEVTIEEQKVIAILVGIHYDFGNLKHGKITNEQFLDKLETLVQKVNYSPGQLNDDIIRLSIFINIADVMGLHYKPWRKTALFPEETVTEIKHASFMTNPYVTLGCGGENIDAKPVAVVAMENLLAYFRETYQANSENSSLYAQGAYA